MEKKSLMKDSHPYRNGYTKSKKNNQKLNRNNTQSVNIVNDNPNCNREKTSDNKDKTTTAQRKPPTKTNTKTVVPVVFRDQFMIIFTFFWAINLNTLFLLFSLVIQTLSFTLQYWDWKS